MVVVFITINFMFVIDLTSMGDFGVFTVLLSSSLKLGMSENQLLTKNDLAFLYMLV